MTCQGLPLVNKALALDALARLLSSDRTLLLRRPRGFGLSTFTSMLAARLDLNYLRDPFPLLTNGKWSRHGLHSYHVLHLDFADLGGSDVNQALLGCLYPAALDLVRRYKLNLTLPDMDYFRKAPYVIVSHLAVSQRLPYLLAIGWSHRFIAQNPRRNPCARATFRHCRQLRRPRNGFPPEPGSSDSVHHRFPSIFVVQNDWRTCTRIVYGRGVLGAVRRAEFAWMPAPAAPALLA